MEKILKNELKLNKDIKLLIGVALTGAFFLAVLCIARHCLFNETEKLLNLWFIHISWDTFMTIYVTTVAVFAGVVCWFQPKRFKYLYIGLVIGYIIFSPRVSWRTFYSEWSPISSILMLSKF